MLNFLTSGFAYAAYLTKVILKKHENEDFRDILEHSSICVSKVYPICSTISAKLICTNQSAYIKLLLKIINICPNTFLNLLQSF